VNNHPIQLPGPIAPPDPKEPEIDPIPDRPSRSDPVTASKKGEDPKRASKSVDRKQLRPGTRQAGRPMPGPVNH